MDTPPITPPSNDRRTSHLQRIEPLADWRRKKRDASPRRRPRRGVEPASVIYTPEGHVEHDPELEDDTAGRVHLDISA